MTITALTCSTEMRYSTGPWKSIHLLLTFFSLFLECNKKKMAVVQKFSLAFGFMAVTGDHYRQTCEIYYGQNTNKPMYMKYATTADMATM